MECYSCGANLSSSDFCNACGVDVKKYKKIMYASNRCYNDGLEKANVRDLSGAVQSLRRCLKLNKNHIDARNLLGLIYFEIGEEAAGLSEWVISMNTRKERNIADEYLEKIQSNQGRLDTLNTTLKKFNVALDLCYQESNDLAVIQLKKVLSMNPKYVKAHKLLSLLYIEKGEFEKARKELEKCLAIDKGNTDCLRYLKEVEANLDPSEDKGKKRGKGIFNEPKIRTYTDGNELIIQPMNDHEPKGIALLLYICLGIIVGVLATYFLIVPSKVKSAKADMNSEISAYGESIDKKNAEITELNNRVTELEQSNLALKDSLEQYEGNNGAVDANNYLISAAYAYMVAGDDYTAVEEYLGLIGQDYLESSASYEYKELYNYLLAQIGDSVATSYYESGIAAYNQMDFGSAIKNLEKACLYNPGSDDALYYLALSYYESGDINKATDKFNNFVAAFPTSALYDKAKQHLDEIGQ